MPAIFTSRSAFGGAGASFGPGAAAGKIPARAPFTRATGGGRRARSPKGRRGPLCHGEYVPTAGGSAFRACSMSGTVSGAAPSSRRSRVPRRRIMSAVERTSPVAMRGTAFSETEA